ncbi:MAG: 50S ribosomal protein L5 [Planctomycetaceae bacterium]|nr:50S ribosomal protein L5 [Planctomycetaceae bacterium]
MARLLEKYRSEIIPALQQELGRKNVHSLPHIEKIVLNMGLGKAVQDRKRLEEALEHMAVIAGQKPQITRAKKSVAGFKLREGMEIGCSVTLRGLRMYEFLDRLITLALPRVRDFRGVKPNAFDGNGNYSLGLSEQMVFPEVDADNAKFTQGMNITIVTSAKNNDEAKTLLTKFGFPFRKPGTTGR